MDLCRAASAAVNGQFENFDLHYTVVDYFPASLFTLYNGATGQFQLLVWRASNPDI